MQQRLALLPTHILVLIAQHEAYGREEIGLARTIATDNDIGLGRERLGLDLVLVCLEALDRDMLDVTHTGGGSVRILCARRVSIWARRSGHGREGCVVVVSEHDDKQDATDATARPPSH